MTITTRHTISTVQIEENLHSVSNMSLIVVDILKIGTTHGKVDCQMGDIFKNMIRIPEWFFIKTLNKRLNDGRKFI